MHRGNRNHLLNGQKAFIYPKYSNEELLDPKDRDRWYDAGISVTAALGVLLPRLDSGGQRLRVWSGKGKVSREGRLHGGVPEGEVQALAPDRHPHGD